MSYPLISVIIPVYNVSEYLEKCVNSVVFQSYKNIEVILVDDGSKDDSGALCDMLAKKYKKVTAYHKTNGGLSSARNYGMDIMKGEYFFFIDSDDYILPETLSSMYHGLKMLNVDIIECQYLKVQGDIAQSSLNNFGLRKDGIKTFVSSLVKWKDHFPMAWNKLYSTKKFGKFRFEEGRLNEDEFFVNTWLPHVEEIGYMSNAFYCYRERLGSIMAKPYSLKRTDAIDAYVRRFEYIVRGMPDLVPDVCAMIAYQVINKTKLVASQGNDGDLTIRKKIAELIIPILDYMTECEKIPSADRKLLDLIQTDFDEYIRRTSK